MKAKIFVTVLSVFFLILAQPGCKTSDEADVSRYTLTVMLSDGVSGTPAAGTYTYEQGDVVNYSYSLMSGYRNLNVTLDGAAVAASGAVTINGNHTLTASAMAGLDIRGRWRGLMVWPLVNPYYIMDFYFDIEFSGDPSSGKIRGVIDLFMNRVFGQYTVDGNAVWFDMSNWYGGFPYIFYGQMENNDLLTGKWEWKEIPDIFYGTFRLERL